MKRRKQPFPLVALLAIVLIASSCTQGLIIRGDKKYDAFAYSEARNYYKRALDKRPNDPKLMLKMANTDLMLNKTKEALSFYKQASDSMSLPPEDKLNYAKVLMQNNQYDDARGVLNSYLQEKPNDQVAKDLLQSTQKVAELKDDTSQYEIKPIPLQNTVSMFGPAFYGKGLVVAAETQIESAATTNPWTGYSYLDMYYMEKGPTGDWEAPEPFDYTLNSRFHDGPATFNKANDLIIFTRSSLNGKKKQEITKSNINNFELLESKKVDGKWSAPVPLSFCNDKYSYGHPSLSADGKTLYFTSDIPGGYGGSDIYKSTFDGKDWSQPVNLGPNINTAANEAFPYISDKGVLYFASEAHQTLGGLDVFKSYYVNGEWSKPQNLAYPLNTSKDDFGLIVNPDDTSGYISSNRNGVDQIYSWTKVPPVLMVEGMARIKATGLPVEGARITLKNVTDGSERTITTGPDGKFKWYLSPNTKYTIKGEKNGYFTESYDVSTGTKTKKDKLDLNFDMDQIVTSPGGGKPNTKTYQIGDVYYDFDSYKVRPDAKPVLDKLVRLLKDNPDISIEIQGHTDCRGSEAYNQRLSDRRAKSVVKYLIHNGIDKNRLKSIGFGETKPAVKCDDCAHCGEAIWQKNRRSEFIVLDKKPASDK